MIDSQLDESVSTLIYAAKTSRIANKPVWNIDMKERQINKLQEQIHIL